MNITWHGNSCFRIQDNSRNGDVSVVIDPFRPEGKIKVPRNLAGDLLLISRDHPRHNNAADVGGEPFVIDGPGEYEIKDVTVTGVSTLDESADAKTKVENTMFYINISGVHLLFLGDLTHSLDESLCKDLHKIDVLFVPVGGKETLSAKQAVDLVGQLEPRVVIPMNFRTGEFGPECDGVDVFLKAMGSGNIEPLPKLKIADKDLPQDEMQIFVLSPQ